MHRRPCAGLQYLLCLRPKPHQHVLLRPDGHGDHPGRSLSLQRLRLDLADYPRITSLATRWPTLTSEGTYDGLKAIFDALLGPVSAPGRPSTWG